MLKQIDFTFRGIDYYMFYDDTHMSSEQALIECEFVGCGMGYNKDLFPYYMIIEKAKEPILKAIGRHCREEQKIVKIK